MHLGDRESDIHLPGTAELHQFLNNGFIIKIGKPAGNKLTLCLNTRRLAEIIITAEIILIQQQVHLFTALAAKVPLLHRYGKVITDLPAMVTMNGYVVCMFNKLVLKNNTAT